MQPYSQNFNKRLIKSPKLYFHDTGLACSLLGIRSPEQVESHFARGALFENMIVAELQKWFLHRGEQARLAFWRDNNGREIDLIVERFLPGGASKRVALEIKSGRTLASEMFDGLGYWQSLSGDAAEDSFLAYGGVERQIRSAGRVVGWKDVAAEVLGTSEADEAIMR